MDIFYISGWRRAAVRDDAGRLPLRLKQGKETLPLSRVVAGLFRQM